MRGGGLVWPLTSPAEAVTNVLLEGLWASQVLAGGLQVLSNLERRGSSGNEQVRPGCFLGRRRANAGFGPLGHRRESGPADPRHSAGSWIGVRVARISGASFTPSWWLPEALPEIPAQHEFPGSNQRCGMPSPQAV